MFYLPMCYKCVPGGYKASAWLEGEIALAYRSTMTHYLLILMSVCAKAANIYNA